MRVRTCPILPFAWVYMSEMNMHAGMLLSEVLFVLSRVVFVVRMLFSCVFSL